MKEVKCKHDFGWSLKKDVYIFVFANDVVEFDFRYPRKTGTGLVFQCNGHPDCKAERIINIKGIVARHGRTSYPKKNKRKV